MESRTDRRKSEVRERILAAAHELFSRQGVATTTVEQICEHADVANRTFFNYYPSRQIMLEALAERLLRPVIADDHTTPTPARLIALFDAITSVLAGPENSQPELVGALINTAACRGARGSTLRDTIVDLINEGVAGGEVTARYDPRVLVDIVIGTLTGVIADWARSPTYGLTERAHELGVVLTGLLSPVAAAGPAPTQPH